ncbi:MAG: response regulator transcription factor [Oscillospiraceae bacterium]|nr:response regulator transcription factor [Oscillospiraceae bacterium]
MNYKCLVIDDDETIAVNTAEYFNIFDISTAYVTSFEDAVSFLDKNTVSLLLLDINLGDRSGFELCKEVRRRYDMPILFISARTSDDDVLTALNIGGDDYIKKPFTLKILLAKVKAILGRYERMTEAASAAPAKAVSASMNGNELRITDDMFLDTAAHNLHKGSTVISLKAMEYKMLLYLLQNKNRVITKDEFLKNVWEDDYVGEGTLAVHIRHLREKIEHDPNMPEMIKTVWGVGYIMETGDEQ